MDHLLGCVHAKLVQRFRMTILVQMVSYGTGTEEKYCGVRWSVISSAVTYSIVTATCTLLLRAKLGHKLLTLLLHSTEKGRWKHLGRQLPQGTDKLGVLRPVVAFTQPNSVL